MVGVEPPIETALKIARQAVRVAVIAERAIQKLLLVRSAVAVGILVKGNIRDAEGDDAVAIWIKPNRDAQAIGKGRDLVSTPVAVCIFKNLDYVAPFAIFGRRKWIFARLADPESATGVEGHVHRLANVRFGGDELDLKTRRNVKGLQLLGRR